MKKLFTLFAIVAVSAIVLVGCKKAEDTTTTAPAATNNVSTNQ